MAEEEGYVQDFDLVRHRVIRLKMFAGLASAGVLDYNDGFDALDTNRGTKGDHNLGRSYLDSNNASTSNGNLWIELRANTLRGGELVSNNLYGYGSYSARTKPPNAPASIAGFFLYQPPDCASEIARLPLQLRPQLCNVVRGRPVDETVDDRDTG